MRKARRPGYQRALAIVGGVLGALVLAAVIVLSFFADGWIEKAIAQEVAELSKRLGRDVRVGEIEVSALRGRVQVRDVSVGPAQDEPEDAQALQLTRAGVDVAMLRTLLSLGLSPRIEAVEAEGVQVQVLKHRDGTLNWQRMGDRLQQTQAPDDSAQAEEEPNQRVRNTVVERLALQNGSVRFVQLGAGREQPPSISQIELQMRDVGMQSGAQVDLKAAVLAAERNLSLRARIKGGDAPALSRLSQLALDMQPTQLAPLAPFLTTSPDAEQALRSGVLSAALRASDRDERVQTQGHVQLSGARFGTGKRFDARLDVDASADREGDRISVRNLALQAGDMKLLAKAEVTGAQDAVRVKDLVVRSEGLGFDALRKIYPALDARTAPARLDGPFSISASGGGGQDQQQARLQLRLTDAVIDVPERFHKPAGTELSLQAQVQLSGESAKIEQATLQLADFRLVAAGTLRELDQAAPRFDIRIDTPNPAAAGLLALLPKVARTAGDRPLAGKLLVKAHAAGTAERFEADGTLRVSELGVNVPGARFAGGGEASLTMRKRDQGSSGKLDLDFSRLTALYEDLIQKPPGTPLRLQASWSQTADGGDAKFSARLASLDTSGTAKLSGRAPNQRFTANVKLPAFALRPLLGLLPQLDPKTVGELQVGGDFQVQGVLGKPESLVVNVPRFTANAQRSDLQGSLKLRNPRNPQIELTARSKYLDLQELLPARADATQPPAKGQEQPSSLAKADGRIDVQVRKGRASGVDYERLKAKLNLKNGRATAQQLEVAAFGGQLQGTGSELPVAPGSGPVHLKGRVQGMQVEGMLATFTDASELLQGALSADVDVSAEDLSAESMKHTLSGKLAGNVADASFLPANGFGKLIDELQAAAKVPGLEQALASAEKRAGKQGAWSLKDLTGKLRFERGAVLIDQPLTAQTPNGKLSVEGRVSLGNASKLEGTYALTPKALSQLTGGEVKLDAPLSVPVSVAGSLAEPRFGFEVDRVLAPLAKSYAREQGKQQVERLIDKTPVKQPAKKARKEVEKQLEDLF